MKALCVISVMSCLVLPMAQGADAQDMPDSAAQAEMMKKSMELAQPGEGHKMLERMAGEWVFESKMWMSADGEPMVIPGKASARMILGGRFLYLSLIHI